MTTMNLCEWPLTDLHNLLPTKSTLLKDLNLTCIAAVSNLQNCNVSPFLALGTDSGMVLGYNCSENKLQKLRCEAGSGGIITCVEIVDTVEFCVAAGDNAGKLDIFVIPKEIPVDVRGEVGKDLAPKKPIKRYSIAGCHKSQITSLQWSKNGMKLFSADRAGVVVLTEIDYLKQIVNSREILKEAHEVVQLSYSKPFLLVSTTFRSVLARQLNNSPLWSKAQVGKKDRKALCKLGATFVGGKLVAARAGYRFWIANPESGEVVQTLQFKDFVNNKNHDTIPLLNPSKQHSKWIPLNFGLVYAFGNDRIVTYSESILYIINIKTVTIEKVIEQLRGILSIFVKFPEIFILETTSTLIRIAPEPKQNAEQATSEEHPLWCSSSSNHDETDCIDVAIVAEEEEELLPPIIPLSSALNATELTKKLRAFSEIQLSDDPIVFQTRGKKVSKSRERSRKTSHEAESSTTAVEGIAPTFLNLSLYVENSDDLSEKEQKLAETLNIEPIKLEPIPLSVIPLTDSSEVIIFPKILPSASDDLMVNERTNLSDDMKNYRKKMSKSMYDKPKEEEENDVEKQKKKEEKWIEPEIPQTPVQEFRLEDYLVNIPNLKFHPVNVEEAQSASEMQSNDDGEEADWEIV